MALKTCWPLGWEPQLRPGPQFWENYYQWLVFLDNMTLGCVEKHLRWLLSVLPTNLQGCTLLSCSQITLLRGDLQSQSDTNIFLQVDSTVDRSQNKVQFFFRTKNVVLFLHMAIFCGQFYITGQHFKVLEMTSNLAYICFLKILRPTVKRWAQSDQQFRSYGIFCVFFNVFFKSGPKKREKIL